MTDLRAGAVKCFGQSVLLQTEDENRKDRRNGDRYDE